jgi:hypothetical protein
MEFVLADGSLADTDIFLFSAGGNNPDILAAHETAAARGARAIHVMTNNGASQLVHACANLTSANVHVLPTAHMKDGFLATHSLVGAITMLLMATDIAANGALKANLAQDFLGAADAVLAPESRKAMAECFESLRNTDTILLLEDPRLSTVGLLIETSVWETALCCIQRTDHRNFAHGRHVWLQHRPDKSMIISLVGPESVGLWKALERSIPSELRRFCLDVKNCGRFENAAGVLRALIIVEALGKGVGIDPARPGVGAFARDMYESRVLLDVTRVLPSAVRHKRAAMTKADLPHAGSLALIESFEALKSRLHNANFRGLVLDYDGTVVTAAERYDAPASSVMEEFERLLREGMQIAIATGRGGSAGERLRDALSQKFHSSILVGYYNGADTRTLDVDISIEPLPKAPAIIEAEKWLDENSYLLASDTKMRRSPVQITLEMYQIRDLGNFQRQFTLHFRTTPELRMVRSGHSIDICLSSACKTKVFTELASAARISPDSILCIGDSGDALGNDYALMGMPFGLSVDQVCCRTETGWALHGAAVTGPNALLHILKALRLQPDGAFKMDVDSL